MSKKSKKDKRPEWTPEGAGEEFTSHVMEGVDKVETVSKKPHPKRRALTKDDYVKGILNGNRTILARAITLVESNVPEHMAMAQDVLKELLPHSGKSIRVGITGVPGVGKSSFIERLGFQLCNQGKKVAVLAVDPSSKVTKGSILGDKTRMEKLSRHPNSFIRPSPSGGTLGGVTRKSRETIVLCEAFGFDTILIETVGVGQSETTVRSMVDFFLLLMLSGAGDELQGIKKGVIELADALVVNKADGDNKMNAELARNEYSRALHYLTHATEGWPTDAYTCSAHTGDGVTELWNVVEDFCKKMKTSGVFEKRRVKQRLEWVFAMVEQELKNHFFSNPSVDGVIPEIKSKVQDGTITSREAAENLLGCYFDNFSKK